ncbi:MAG: hypothetical protein GFH25_541218n22 [Chloroflexi bacterium AL-N10]|nr:hypothetical protein [Chloroflexi bacterium AL-N1]NOK69884.1 hypothetical protein [Chloroflexi bacterium AL-N10]NOK73819.1 hypothetical protein [Chloroflexi bacterium AL-N5]NOK91617.1 hypothetical protein [Chloroflexi bacterium AL-N15]
MEQMNSHSLCCNVALINYDWYPADFIVVTHKTSTDQSTTSESRYFSGSGRLFVVVTIKPRSDPDLVSRLDQSVA